MKATQKKLQALKGKIPEVSPAEAHKLQQDGAVLIDVREQDEFAQGGPALIILTGAVFYNSCVGSCGAIIRMAGWSRLVLANTFAVSGLNFLLNFLLIPRFGILGAAIATGAAIVVGNFLGLAQVRWFLKLSPYDRKWVKPLVAGLAGGLLVAGLQRVAPVAPPVWNLALSTGAFSLCYVGLLLLQQLEREDLQMLRLLRAKVFRSQGAG